MQREEGRASELCVRAAQDLPSHGRAIQAMDMRRNTCTGRHHFSGRHLCCFLIVDGDPKKYWSDEFQYALSNA